MKRSLFFLVCCAFAATVGAQQWPTPQSEAKPGTRW